MKKEIEEMKRKYSTPMVEKVEFKYSEQVVASNRICNSGQGYYASYDGSQNPPCESCASQPGDKNW